MSAQPSSQDHNVARRLQSQTAIVTGSTSGIGAAIAAALAAEGAHVVFSGRDLGRGEALASTIRELGNRADFVAADLAEGPAQIRAFATGATRMLGGRVDILVNNAGIYPAPATPDLTDADLDTMLAVNVRAPHVLVATIAPKMTAQGSGTIINIGSWMARIGSPYGVMYTASKAALEQMTRGWAAEFGQAGIRVNTVAPGVTLTPGNAAHRPIIDQMTASTPGGEAVKPQDVANAVVFLASNDAAMLHGSTIDVDGGIGATRLG